MRAPSPWQQFIQWRDSGDQNAGPLNMMRWNEFTGERRAAYINHMFIGALEGIAAGLVFVGMSLGGIVAVRPYYLLGALSILVAATHGMIMTVRRETYWQLKWRELQTHKTRSDENLQELLQYAEKIQKGKV